ncbi:MAG TPA: endo-1,4-beta-xylanase [Phycisphaerae bacterium]|nr:endo-1,4-beta-xylanase [Phycisphaerae bacterium]
MLRFDVHQQNGPVEEIDLTGAYVFGEESIPVRADIAASKGQISCMKRVPGACGMSLLWNAGQAGRVLMSTTRVPERAKPYNLNVELARAQMTRLAQKCEDWGLFDYPEAEPLNREFGAIRRQFVESLKASDPAEAARLADAAITDGVVLGEKMALFHADIFLDRRKALSGGAKRTPFGCVVDLLSQTNGYRERLRETFDFLSIPMPWKHTEPRERVHEYSQVDTWINWAARARKPVHLGPLLSFDPEYLPEWLYIWEHDYESLRDLIYENIQRTVKRYERQVRLWKVVSGVNAYNSFDLSFDQLMELTRMSSLLVKRLVPRSVVLIELAMPWGEYYARNQRTIPPLLYADMAVQSGVKFDAFGVQVLMGVPVDGLYVRDLFQISSLLDEFATLGKPVHITACQVPSDVGPDAWDAWGGTAPVSKAGQWHNPWSQRLQAEWLQAFYRVAISKPFVESVCWRDLADYEGHYIPHGGLCRNDLEPKLAYKELRNFKAALMAGNTATEPRRNEDPQ